MSSAVILHDDARCSAVHAARQWCRGLFSPGPGATVRLRSPLTHWCGWFLTLQLPPCPRQIRGTRTSRFSSATRCLVSGRTCVRPCRHIACRAAERARLKRHAELEIRRTASAERLDSSPPASANGRPLIRPALGWRTVGLDQSEVVVEREMAMFKE